MKTQHALNIRENALDIHERALDIVDRYLKSESEVIAILLELDQGRKYIEKDCRSLFEYATRFLKLSEAVAFTFINVGRKARDVPALKEAIDRKEITTATARKITSVITKENATEWIAKAQTLSQPNLEKEVARVNPKAAVQEKAKYITFERLKLELGISEELMKKLRRVQDLESKTKSASLEDALEAMTEVYLEKNDPIRVEQRIQARKQNEKQKPTSKDSTQNATDSTGSNLTEPLFLRTVNPGSCSDPSADPSADPSSASAGATMPLETTHTPATKPKSYPLLKRQVLARDQARCTHRDENGSRCGQTRFLHVHHIQERAFGGQDTPANLTSLCSFHHRRLHA